MAETAIEVVEKVREIHVAQCNVMLEKVWPAVLMGDIAAINRGAGDSAQEPNMGVDLQPMVGRGDATRFNADGAPAPDQVISLVIEGNPELNGSNGLRIKSRRRSTRPRRAI